MAQTGAVDLELEYSPSHFSTRFKTSDEIVANHLEFGFLESEKNRFNSNCHLNIGYGSSPAEILDIYGADLPDDSPIFVYIHGGYWQMDVINKWSAAYAVRPMLENAKKVMVVEYDNCPKITLQEVVEQLKRAFAWIAEYAKENNVKSIAFAGHSAGAHLVATSLTKEFFELIGSEIKINAYLISGVFELTELRTLKAANENNILSLTETNAKELSPQYQDYSHLTNANIQIQVLVGENESKKFIEQSKNFGDHLKKYSPKTIYKLMEKLDHFDIVEKLAEKDYELTKTILGSL
ncbi:unnamed protein product [Diamesa serratosioi]